MNDLSLLVFYVLGFVTCLVLTWAVGVARMNRNRPQPKTKYVGIKPNVYRVPAGAVISTRGEIVKCDLLCQWCGINDADDIETATCNDCAAMRVWSFD